MHERSTHSEFRKLQDALLEEFGMSLPTPPELKVHAIAQTSITLSWTPLQLYKADLRALEVYRDNERVKTFNKLPTPEWTKLGGLVMDKEYEFYLKMRTSAGTFESNRVRARTHTLDNLSGIRVSFGEFERGEQEEALEKLKECLGRMGASWIEEGVVGRDTTHLVARIAKGPEYEEALRWNIPVVRPEWLFVCEQKKKLQSAGAYYIKNSVTANSHQAVVRSIPEL